MRYQISGKQIDVGEALQTHVKAEMGEVVEKYAQRPTECVVVFSRVAHEFVCEATIHLSTGLTAQAKGHASEDIEDAEPETLQPVVIAEMETKIPSITVGEAVMQLELAGQRMLVFRNEGHGGVNVVYRRDDGNIGWIDPRNSK
jgi:ribosomal subunit interface protein